MASLLKLTELFTYGFVTGGLGRGGGFLLLPDESTFVEIDGELFDPKTEKSAVNELIELESEKGELKVSSSL